MPGVVFLIVVPTANFERELIYGTSNNALVETSAGGMGLAGHPGHLVHGHPVVAAAAHGGGNNNLNINLPENNNAILRLEVELRDKNVPKYRRGVGGGPGIGQVGGGRGGGGGGGGGGGPKRTAGVGAGTAVPIGPADTSTVGAPLDRRNLVVPLEKVLEELLVKLEIEHVTWTTSKKGYFHHVVFPLQAGAACETTLHCLTELGIGTKLNSCVSVLPCSVSYDAITDAANMRDDYSEEAEDASKWNSFVESIKSKLTVKQVVDGVRAGGSLSFDYLLLIVTADSLAALGLVENNAPNIVAAMLVSPLMGPVMSITFGAIISDKELMRVGFLCLGLGMFISLVFGFIFGLILGTTEMPWGQNADWPTEEMRGRFWETDLRTVRKTNRSTMRHPRSRSSMAGGPGGMGTVRGLDKFSGGSHYHGLDERDAQMDNALERALAQAENDATFKKVKRMSYSSNAAGELTERLAKIAGLNRLKTDGDPGQSSSGSLSGSRMNSIPNSQLNVDLKVLDKLVSSLLEQHTSGAKGAAASFKPETGSRTPPLQRMASKKLNRWRPLSRSAHSYKRHESSDLIGGSFTQLMERVDPPATSAQHPPNMPTIMESSAGSPVSPNPTPNNAQQQAGHPPMWNASLDATPGAVRNVLHGSSEPEDQLNLTHNYVG
ncbi:uncharacterized protein [Drosophila suzukii]|uniref:Uncharacterized protein isoform X2 n=1 Tax=Drosophila suzukii TaxID=28584 RepID=A0AB40A2V5_DROSZ